MQELGYEPGNSGPSMPGSKTIGIVLPVSEDDTFENAFFLETMRGISLFCNQKQYFTTLITGSSNEELLSSIRAMVRENHLDGIILLYSNAQDPIIDYLYENGILFVQIGKASQYPGETICIDNDNILAAREAVSYLFSLGHRRIGYVGTDLQRIFSADRKAGYMLALAEKNVPFRESYYLEMPRVPKEEPEELLEFLSGEDRPTAVLVSDDILAMALVKTALELHLHIPEDLSVMGFDDHSVTQLDAYNLTTVSHQREKLYQAVLQALEHHLLEFVAVVAEDIDEKVRFVAEILVKAAPWDPRSGNDLAEGHLPVGLLGKLPHRRAQELGLLLRREVEKGTGGHSLPPWVSGNSWYTQSSAHYT